MNQSYTPLRYPGGKAAIIQMMIDTIILNKLQLYHYAEPFAGGCGLALGLLMRGYVSHIHINDIDKGIWSFWHSVLTETDRFVSKMWSTDVTIDEWHKQREIIRAPERFDPFELGFATFFMNRTNRSGIISAGVIGGLKQEGHYLLDCRFNKERLEHRIRRIKLYAKNIHLTNLDAVDFLNDIDASPYKMLLCIDPPYYKKGQSLYTNFYKSEDHVILANKISQLRKPWIITYDNESVIKNLYLKYKMIQYNLNYFAHEKRVGTELMIFSNDINIPSDYNVAV